MSWSTEVFIGELRPWPDTVHVIRGKTDEMRRYVPERTCEYVIEDNMNESEGMGDVWFRCTNCETCYDYYADDWLLKMPNCPKCGATVKGVR